MLANKQSTAGLAVLKTDKINFKLKVVRRNKGTHYRVIKGSIQHEDITIANVSVLNIRTPNYMKQKQIELQGEINSNAVVARAFTTPVSKWGGYFR